MSRTHASTRPPGPPGPRMISSLIELIGDTPLLRLHNIADAQGAEVWVKCEHYNPGGSVKDRIALAMIETAEARGDIRPGQSVIIEPTSGNTGIGLALVCAAKGYRLILTMPSSMSLERRALLQSYGAELILTEPERNMEGAVARAIALCRDHADYYMPDQFNNPANPATHRATTGPELLAQVRALPQPDSEPGSEPDSEPDSESAPGTEPEREIHAFVAGIGTGGTISGVGQVLREAFPECRVVGIEPAKSAVITGGAPGLHMIQGIGAGFIPKNLDRAVMTEVRTLDDRVAYLMSRRLAREEGLLVGISSGANVSVACDIARELGPGKMVTTLLCDSGERYFSLDEFFQP